MAKKKAKSDDEKEPEAAAVAIEPEPQPDTPEHDHYLRIRELNREVMSSRWEWESAKETAAARKKTFDSLMMDLTQEIARGPEVMPLFDAPEAEAWKSRPLSDLSIADGIISTLAENGISTLGELKAFWDGGKLLCDCSGIGAEKSATVADAFHAYGEKHPEVFGEQAPPADDEPPTAVAGPDDEV